MYFCPSRSSVIVSYVRLGFRYFQASSVLHFSTYSELDDLTADELEDFFEEELVEDVAELDEDFVVKLELQDLMFFEFELLDLVDALLELLELSVSEMNSESSSSRLLLESVMAEPLHEAKHNKIAMAARNHIILFIVPLISAWQYRNFYIPYMLHTTIYDPIRKKDVPATPEEHVRQATIHFLLNELKVPAHLIAVEFGLCAIDPKTDDRVDIMVHNFRKGAPLDKPWLLVECKAPGEYTWEALQVQLNKYLRILTPKYVMLALGDTVRFFKLEGRAFTKISAIPEY